MTQDFFMIFGQAAVRGSEAVGQAVVFGENKRHARTEDRGLLSPRVV